MNLRDLEYFLVMVDTGQLAIAATRMGVTQPAMTKCLKRLEVAVGNPLFERTPKGLVLTQLGHILCMRGRKLLLGMEDIQRELADMTSGDSGQLRIGAGPTMTEYLLPEVAATLLKQRPGVTLQIVIAHRHTLMDQLKVGDLDIVIGSVSENAQPGFSQTTLWHDEVVVVASHLHPLLKKRIVSLRDLSQQIWVLPSSKVLARIWLDHKFSEMGLLPPKVSAEADSANTTMAILAQSQLIGFQPRLIVHTLRFEKEIRELNAPDAIWRRSIGITVRDDQYMSPIGRDFMGLLQAAAGKWVSSASKTA